MKGLLYLGKFDMAYGKRRRGRRARSRGNGTGNTPRARHTHPIGSPLSRKLHLEELEDRRLLALYVVNNLSDLDAMGDVVIGSLRQAVQLANADEGRDTIIFRPDLFDGGIAGTISLDARMNGGPLVLTDIAGVDIIGPGPLKLTVNAAGNNRIFLVDDGDENISSRVTLSGMTFSSGGPLGDDEEGRGGAILNRESLSLTEVRLLNNSAAAGGAIFNELGSLRIERSLIQGNTSQMGGGGVQNGLADQTENLPSLTITNSTVTGNTAIGIPMDEMPTGYGGGVLNLAGTVNIEQSTIFGNTASDNGGGVASRGFDAMFDAMSGEPGVTVGTATTNLRSSIFVGNMAMGAPNDVANVGMTEEQDMMPAVPFEPQINSLGYNLFGVLDIPGTSANMDIMLPLQTGDVVGVLPGNLFVEDINGDPVLMDFGGVLPVYMPDPLIVGNLAIDHGDPANVLGEFDQRGIQFVRVSAVGAGMPRMDVGAAEVQVGNFVVNTLVDESDGRYSDVPFSVGTFPTNTLSLRPDFSLREALQFVQKNQQSGVAGTSTVSFSSLLTDPTVNPDPTLGSSAPTILLSLGELSINFPVLIQGPAFDLEIDATGNDPTPGLNNGDGSRVFSITDTVEISNLQLRGGDQQEFGGAIFANGDLTLRNVSLFDNTTTGSGGAVYVQNGDLLFEKSAVYENVAAGSGGGIYVAAGNVTVSNSTISGNTAALRGGGLANANGQVLIQYSTITLNTASSTQGSGVAHFKNGSANTQIRSSIIAGNTINDVQQVLTGASVVTSLGYNLVGNGNAVTAGIFSAPGDQPNVTDPMLGALTRLGGPTPAHRLLPGSPAFDAGDPNAAGLGNVPLYDQRGFPFDRIEGGGPIDIGAFEVQDDVFLVGDGSSAEGSYSTFIAALQDANLTPTKETIVFLPTWVGENFPGGTISITDSVDIIGLFGIRFFGNPTLTIMIDDGDNNSLSDISFTTFRFESNTTVVSQENLTFDDMQFVDNTTSGAINHQNGDLTILNSTFIGNSGASGGAIHVLNGDLHIENSFLSGSTATAGNGGAIYLRNGEFTGNYLYLTGNAAPAATGEGGAFYVRDATVMLNNAVISGNTTTGSNSEGGGVSIKDSDVTLNNSYVTFNNTTGSQSGGGGIFIDGGSLTLENSNVIQNQTTGQSSSGGGIASLNANLTITGSTVGANQVSGVSTHGGGIHAIGGDLIIRDSAVINNEATAANSKGGGIYSDTNLLGTQKASLINSTVSGNTATWRGGGVYHADGLLEISYSTITNNSVPYFGDGGGVASFGNSSTTLTRVRSAIIAGNFSTNDPVNPNSDVENVAGNSTNSFVSLGYNLIGKGVALALNTFTQIGDTNNVVDPGLAALANNGGPTSTHALLPSSQAINRGDPNAMANVGNVPEFDQRGTGFSRVVNGRIDIGAFESNLSPAIVFDPTDFNEDGETSGLDFLLWQIGFGKPNATKSDGDSDGDMDVDATDLANWEAAYGDTPLIAALQSGPAASSASVAEEGGFSAWAVLAETAPQTDSSVDSAVSIPEPDSVNPAQGQTVIYLGLASPSLAMTPLEAVVAQEDETAAIDESLAELGQTDRPTAGLDDDGDYEHLALSRQGREEEAESAADFEAEDSVFAMLGEGVF